MNAGMVILTLVATVLLLLAVVSLLHECNTDLETDLTAAHAENRRLRGQVMLANTRLASVTGHPSATVVPIKRDAR